MKKSLLESILDKPPLYCGRAFSTIDEFKLFFAGVTVGLFFRGADVGSESKTVFSAEEAMAINRFGEFMRYNLYGQNKNCRWEYDLLAKHGCHQKAIQSATALMKYFHNRLCEEGIENIDKIFGEAHKKHVYRFPRVHVADFSGPEGEA